VDELFDINSCRSPPLSSFSPTYVSGGKKVSSTNRQMSQSDLFQGMPSFNHYHSYHYIWSKNTNMASLCTKVNAG
jgi:hypothetical protein